MPASALRVSRPTIATALLLLLASIPPCGASSGEDAHEVCGSCHLPRGDERDPSGPCLGCHADVLVAGGTRASASPAGHVGRSGFHLGGPKATSEITCATCHDPHATARPHGLRPGDPARPDPPGSTLDETTRLCLTCHDEFAEIGGATGHFIRHPVGLPAPDRAVPAPGRELLPLADVAGTTDPRDDVISCATCHLVHRNDRPFLLRWERAEEVRACTQCHLDLQPPETAVRRPAATSRRPTGTPR